jgi:hypothetical protein
MEFGQLVADHLTDRGMYMVNIIDGTQGDFFRAYVSTLGQVFPHIYVSAITGEIGSSERQTYVILASHNNLDEMMAQSPLQERFVSQETVESYLNEKPHIQLSDDYVPVDNLLAPVFADSGL